MALQVKCQNGAWGKQGSRSLQLKYLKLWKILTLVVSTEISKNWKSLEIYEMNRINFELQLKKWKWTWSLQFSLNGWKLACSPVGLAQWIEHCVQSSQRSGFASQSSLNFHLLRLFIQLRRIKIMFTFIQISNILSSVMFMLLFITFSTMVVTI